ncbi:Protein of unknown function [Gryllus bimaculatus]|nr:Protein of unknown function [Gryllus bimaculatus]
MREHGRAHGAPGPSHAVQVVSNRQGSPSADATYQPLCSPHSPHRHHLFVVGAEWEVQMPVSSALVVAVCINDGQVHTMEIDSMPAVTVMHQETFRHRWPPESAALDTHVG